MLSGQVVAGGRTARWWFTDRQGGVSAPPFDSLNLAAHVGDDLDAVRRNRDLLEDTVNAGQLSWMGPVHGVDLEDLREPAALTPNVDALATTRTGLPLVTLGADCVPLLMVAGEVAIAAHIGWRGFVDGMLDTLCDAVQHHGADISAAQILLGPAICGACYGVPEERAHAIGAIAPTALVDARAGGIGADIRQGLLAGFTARGADVRCIGPCTFEDPLYFSHRRDGVTGRQGGVIVWE